MLEVRIETVETILEAEEININFWEVEGSFRGDEGGL